MIVPSPMKPRHQHPTGRHVAKKVHYPYRLQLRYGEAHLEALHEAQNRHRIRAHDFIRASILNQRITAASPPPPAINIESARLLSKMSLNLNQIARRWNEYPLEGITRQEIEDINSALAYLAAQLLGYSSGLDHIMAAGFARIVALGRTTE